jgi:hypothetical protein
MNSIHTRARCDNECVPHITLQIHHIYQKSPRPHIHADTGIHIRAQSNIAVHNAQYMFTANDFQHCILFGE